MIRFQATKSRPALTSQAHSFCKNLIANGMYVDLPASAVRYCFRTLADATAFRRRFGHATQRRTVGGVN